MPKIGKNRSYRMFSCELSNSTYNALRKRYYDMKMKDSTVTWEDIIRNLLGLEMEVH